MNLYSCRQLFDLPGDLDEFESNRIKIGFSKTGVLQVPVSEMMQCHIGQIEKDQSELVDHKQMT